MRSPVLADVEFGKLAEKYPPQGPGFAAISKSFAPGSGLPCGLAGRIKDPAYAPSISCRRWQVLAVMQRIKHVSSLTSHLPVIRPLRVQVDLNAYRSDRVQARRQTATVAFALKWIRPKADPVHPVDRVGQSGLDQLSHIRTVEVGHSRNCCENIRTRNAVGYSAIFAGSCFAQTLKGRAGSPDRTRDARHTEFHPHPRLWAGRMRIKTSSCPMELR